MYEVQEAFDR
jgi:DNA repair exonuclease SbcCD ATPase subunit